MRNGGTTTISSRVPKFLKKLLDECAKNREITESEFIAKMVIENIDKYKELTPLEKEYVIFKKKEIISDVHKELRSFSAERMTFLKNIRNAVLKLCNDNYKVDKKLLIENMKQNLEIAKVNNWKKEEILIKKYITSIRKNEIESLRTMRGVDYDEKKPTSFIEYRKNTKNN